LDKNGELWLLDRGCLINVYHHEKEVSFVRMPVHGLAGMGGMPHGTADRPFGTASRT